MSIHGIELRDDEEIEYDTHPSYWKHPLLTVSVIFLPLVWFTRGKVRYVVTNERVMRFDGRVTTDSQEFRHEDIREIETESSMLPCGNVTLETHSGGQMELKAVPRHQKVCNVIRNNR